eukprot:12453974-Prorocentrum_lima.AAC.1
MTSSLVGSEMCIRDRCSAVTRVSRAMRTNELADAKKTPSGTYATSTITTDHAKTGAKHVCT